jgi:predicted transcriptional regulator
MQFKNIKELNQFLPYGSQRKIATKLGISHVLVSRILTEQEGLRISNETIAAVVREAKELAAIEQQHIDEIRNLTID